MNLHAFCNSVIQEISQISYGSIILNIDYTNLFDYT